MSISTAENVTMSKNKGETGRLKKRIGTMTGKVVRGNKIGRTIGFPTANLSIDKEDLSLEKGVYGVRVFHDNHLYLGIMNIGTRPTINSKDLKIHYEVHILNFSQMIYDQILTIDVCFFIRKETKFNSLDQLVGQITRDIDFVQKRF
ncbi:hypothetical protein A8F95_04295 [Bacillus wudalianchiensis]|uniref:riboflavin kinase n=2 Tax=Pseudobacillus wudalianchiensis TaxID=1743143 RepID=A0A1B9BA11_9BACI|nr:hypothetical protein A8F95_04295 [Bacillus wudalianchiensis]